VGWTIETIAGLLINLVGLAFTGSTILYRIKMLEKKVEKHNNVVERVYIVEGKINAMLDDIKEVKSK